MSRPAHTMTTTAAEGLARRRFTVVDVEQMAIAGIVDWDERIELIGGEIVPMAPKGFVHETLKTVLNMFWVRRLPEDMRLACATTFRLSTDTFLESDFVAYSTAVGRAGLTGSTALLVVEIADNSLGYDLGRKAGLYAGFGIAELWVIDAVKLVTHIHREPMADGYRSVIEAPASLLLVPGRIPAAAVTLADLELD